jgi:hypothetical protein
MSWVRHTPSHRHTVRTAVRLLHPGLLRVSAHAPAGSTSMLEVVLTVCGTELAGPQLNHT